MSTMDDIEFKIARLDLRPGDILIVKCKERLSAGTLAIMREVLARVAGGHKALILENGMDLAVLTAAQIEERSVSAVPSTDPSRKGN